MTLLALIALLYFAVSRTTDQLQQEFSQSLDNQVAKLIHMDEMLRALQKRHVLIYSIVGMEDPFKQDEAILQHAALAQEYVEARNAYLALPRSAEEVTNFEHLLLLNRQGYLTQQEIINAIQSGKQLDVAHIVQSRLYPILDGMYQYIRQMRLRQLERTELARQQIQETIAASRQLVLFLFLTALVLGSLMFLLSFRLHRRHQKQLAWQANHDSLTGLYNRYAFESMLDESIRTAIEDHQQHVALYIDVDQFKLVNDTAGHTVGDEMLRQIAGRIQRLLPRNGYLSRLGGDEFGVLLEYGDEGQAILLAERILAALKTYQFYWSGHSFQVTASIGIVLIDGKMERSESLLSALDLACYTAKEKGRNRFHIFRESDEDTSSRRGEMFWANKVRDALQEKRFLLYRQPIMRCHEASPDDDHHEILIRLQEKDGNIIQPERFIRAAERYDLCPLVDMEVLRGLTSHIRDHVQDQCRFSVNLSGASLTSLSLLDSVLQMLEETGVDARRLCFEITETAAITNLEAAKHFMDTLRQQGCRFSLDDFGTGLSSFNYLRELAVDYVKIDGSFIRNLVHSSSDLAIVVAMNEVVHALGLKTIAEGIEDEATLQVVQQIGIDYAQGFYLARPRPLMQAA